MSRSGASRTLVAGVTCAASSACVAAIALAGPPKATAAELLARVARHGKGTHTLQVRFVQRKRLALFATEVVTRGICRYRHPDAIRWETLPPDASVILIRGGSLSLRAPGERPKDVPLDKSPVLAGLIEELFVWLGVRPAAELDRRYEIAVDPDNGPGLRLRPRQAPLKQRIEEVRIALGARGEVRRIDIAQRDGDRTSIELGAVQRDVELPANLFK